MAFIKTKLYTKEDIENISGVNLVREGFLYEPLEIDIRILSNYCEFKREADSMKDCIPPYIQFMIDRLRLRAGLQSMIIEDNYLMDGAHRILAYILAGVYTANVLNRISNNKINKMRSVQAKFKCISVTDFGSVKNVDFNAVYGSDGENKDFANATPSGKLSMTINSERPAFDFFKPGLDYYLTITESRVIDYNTVAETVIKGAED